MRLQESPRSRPDLSKEQLSALRHVRRVIGKFLDDPDLCTWIREQYIQEKMTIRGVVEKFIASDWGQRYYPEECQSFGILNNVMHSLRYELLTSEEIIKLNELVYKRRAKQIAETRGLLWTEEKLQVLRNILDEPGAQRRIIVYRYVAQTKVYPSVQTVFSTV